MANTAAPLDDATRTSIIIAAVTAAGSTEPAKVAEAAATLTDMLHEDSDISRIINGVRTAKRFRASILGIEREKSSTRGLVRLKTGTTRAVDGLPLGQEQARTDRTDNNEYGRAMANRLRSLIGHDVLISIEVEEFTKKDGNTSKVRVIRFVKDLGLSSDPEAAAAKAAVDAAKAARAAQA